MSLISLFHNGRFCQDSWYGHIATLISLCKVHPKSKEQCTADKPSDTCNVFYSWSCNRNIWVPYKLVWLSVRLSTTFPSLPQPSSSNPIHSEMEALELQSSSGPSSDSLVGSPLDVLDECSLCKGRPSIALPLWVITCFLASLTHFWLLVRSFSKQTNHSSGANHSCMDCGVGLATRHRMLGWHLHMHSRCPMQSSYPCLQNRTLYHTQWKHKILVKRYTDQDPLLWLFHDKQGIWSS